MPGFLTGYRFGVASNRSGWLSRGASVTAVLGCACVARANGSMGLAFELFEVHYWAAYVLATVCVEAWLIGRGLGNTWIRALWLSALANASSALLAGCSCLIPFLHPNSLNPNPLGYAVALFTCYAIVSSAVESIAWSLGNRSTPVATILRKSIIAHAVGVPLAMMILLLPKRPYVGLEHITGRFREQARSFALENFLPTLVVHGRFPNFATAEAFMRAYAASPHPWLDKNPGTWAAAYEPDFDRFDTGERRRLPILWNPHVAGIYCGHISGHNTRLNAAVNRSIWIMAVAKDGLYSGYALDVRNHETTSFAGVTRDRLLAAERRAIQDAKKPE